MEAWWLDEGHQSRHGMVTWLARESGVLRNTITNWLTKSALPRLDALGAVAEKMDRERAELVAAWDGQELVTYDRARQIVREELAAAHAEEPGARTTPGSRGGSTGGSGPRRMSAAS